MHCIFFIYIYIYRLIFIYILKDILYVPFEHRLLFSQFRFPTQHDGNMKSFVALQTWKWRSKYRPAFINVWWGRRLVIFLIQGHSVLLKLFMHQRYARMYRLWGKRRGMFVWVFEVCVCAFMCKECCQTSWYTSLWGLYIPLALPHPSAGYQTHAASRQPLSCLPSIPQALV